MINLLKELFQFMFIFIFTSSIYSECEKYKLIREYEGAYSADESYTEVYLRHYIEIDDKYFGNITDSKYKIYTKDLNIFLNNVMEEKNRIKYPRAYSEYVPFKDKNGTFIIGKLRNSECLKYFKKRK